ncbi:hypothetical protein MG293_010841 [Ovis ammon polii]|uniref:Uncharacterized protein n=1 Tax=Ovis ammon polii TaxID=230172 RepID=A0AAD4U833_OVIAM|nr:hypothetical protein MG293_010841 [Ovis ammon polii]
MFPPDALSSVTPGSDLRPPKMEKTYTFTCFLRVLFIPSALPKEPCSYAFPGMSSTKMKLTGSSEPRLAGTWQSGEQLGRSTRGFTVDKLHFSCSETSYLLSLYDNLNPSAGESDFCDNKWSLSVRFPVIVLNIA